MLKRMWSVLLLVLSACATTQVGPRERVAVDVREANLRRAAALPWTDEGRCVVREAANEWAVVAERCFHALDHSRVRFQDVTGRCGVASAGMAVGGVGLCLLAAPEIAGAVLVLGVVVVGVAIVEELKAYRRSTQRDSERKASGGPARPEAQEQPGAPEPRGNPEPQPKHAPIRDYIPPGVSMEPQEEDPACIPKRVPPRGGNRLHNKCADLMPGNAFVGANALLKGKAFDALQPLPRRVWEIKTTAIETYNPFVRDRELEHQVEEALHEIEIAETCGYEFVIGVRTEAHREMLKKKNSSLKVEIMDWCKNEK